MGLGVSLGRDRSRKGAAAQQCSRGGEIRGTLDVGGSSSHWSQAVASGQLLRRTEPVALGLLFARLGIQLFGIEVL